MPTNMLHATTLTQTMPHGMGPYYNPLYRI